MADDERKVKDITRLLRRKAYSFEPDSESVRKQKGNVVFLLELKGLPEDRDTDPNEVRTAMDLLTDNVGYGRYSHSGSSMLCWTDKQTYERIFQSELEVDLARRCESGYTYFGCREKTPAVVPECLTGLVQRIYLDTFKK